MEFEDFGDSSSVNVPPSQYDNRAQQQSYQGSGNSYQGGSNNNGSFSSGGSGYSNNGGNQGGQQRSSGYGGGYNGGGQGGYNKGNGGGGQGGFNRGGGKGGFQRKPEVVTDKLYKPYAVMSNDQIPEHALRQIQHAVERLNNKGFTARTNCSKGAAMAIEQIATSKELILPWSGFEGRETKMGWTTGTALATTGRYHQSWDGLSDAVKKIIASGVRLIAGDKMNSPALFLICWSQDGANHGTQVNKGTGNLSIPLSVASDLLIPIFNLGKEGDYERLMRHIGE